MLRYRSCPRCEAAVPMGPPLCLRCGANLDFQSTENHLRDFVTRYEVGQTAVWIFPTSIFKGQGLTYWSIDEPENAYPFLETPSADTVQRHQGGYLCDAVVDSANNYLIAGSGLARHLDETLGEPYRKQRQALLDAHHGELVHGSSYFLPLSFGRVLRGIVEAISVRYSRGDARELTSIHTRDEHVRNCVFAALLRAHENACRSLAIPQMASRPGYSIYGPTQAPAVMVNATLNAIVSFLVEVKPTSLQRICLHPADDESEEQMVLFFNRLKG